MSLTAVPSTFALRKCGQILRPPLATVPATQASCSGVIETPCPMLMVAQLVPVQADSDGRMPPTSPGKSTPVLWTTPHRFRYSSSRFEPKACETWMVPTLDDWLIICEKDSCLVGNGSASLKVLSATFSWDWTFITVSGLTTPSWSAATAVTIFIAEPGS